MKVIASGDESVLGEVAQFGRRGIGSYGRVLELRLRQKSHARLHAHPYDVARHCQNGRSANAKGAARSLVNAFVTRAGHRRMDAHVVDDHIRRTGPHTFHRQHGLACADGQGQRKHNGKKGTDTLHRTAL